MLDLTDHDVFAEDGDPLVSIGPGVLVPETDHVAQLMNDDAELVAVLADRNGLWTVSAFPHKRATA